ncbi:MAG: restriction endonuclease [Sphingomonadales bacterium]|nr:restriction endonuclease [Sphingomonadales bacterium]
MASTDQKNLAKQQFSKALTEFVGGLAGRVCTPDGQWAVKGFVDAYLNVYSISSDTKVTSKILEIHIFPMILEFARENGFVLELPEHQNHYPDMSFIHQKDQQIKFAVDLKTTYRKPEKPFLCNGFTLGSYAGYFTDRGSAKNILYPYSDYSGHFCLGLIYDRAKSATIDETKQVTIKEVEKIASVMSNMQFFVAEKWQLASDRKGSGNTANIGSIVCIEDILAKNGIFAKLGEAWFDEYWMNHGKLKIPDNQGNFKPLGRLDQLVAYRNGDVSKIVPRRTKG